MSQRGEAEIGGGRSSDCHANGADALLDLVLGIEFVGLELAVDQALAFGLRQILMAPGVRAHGMAGRGHLLENAGLIGRVQADREEDCLGAMGGQRRQHRGRIFRPGTVVEGQHHFAGPQEIMLLEVLEPELRAAGGVDFYHARDAQRVRVARAGGGGGCRACGLGGGGRW